MEAGKVGVLHSTSDEPTCEAILVNALRRRLYSNVHVLSIRSDDDADAADAAMLSIS